MCRNIRPLFNFDPPATDEEIYNAALQYVRKLSGFQKPSKVNEKKFEKAVKQISKATKDLLENLETHSHPHDREEEKEKARARIEKRFGKTVV